MSVTSQRLLRLLSLLAARSEWTGAELAARLGVTERTVRRDIARIRELGYHVEGLQGLGGGYHLGRSGVLPPLVLDDEEAIAVAACLRAGAPGGSGRIAEAALRALGKLQRMLPPAIAAKVVAVDDAVQALSADAPFVEWSLLLTLAQAGRDHRLVRFRYQRRDGQASERTVEPARILTHGRRWYLLAFDRDRQGWRTFRLDRMSGAVALTFGFQPREAPDAREALLGDDGQRWRHYGIVRFGCDAGALADVTHPGSCSVLSSGPDAVTVRVGSDSWEGIAWHLLGIARRLRTTLEVVEGDELRLAFRELGEASLSASGSAPFARG